MTAPSAYLPQRFGHSIDLDLSKNEGRPGSTELLAAVEDPTELLRRYPDTSRLQARLAKLHGVSQESVLVTAGGDDALMRCFMARTGRGRQVLTTRPTFEMIPRYAEQSGAAIIEIPWRSGPSPPMPSLTPSPTQQMSCSWCRQTTRREPLRTNRT